MPPGQRFRTGSRGREKKAEARIGEEYLNAALAGFSGYIAADELYDGPFCVLSIVDNRTFRRLLYEVLETDPTHADIERFFRRFRDALEKRGLKLLGVTTDGSPLYPEALAAVFGAIQHQICEFHILQDINRAVLKAINQVRRTIRSLQPRVPRGRPSSAAAKSAARKKKRLEKKAVDLFENRYLFVQRHLSAAEMKTLRRITRGLPALLTLRTIMDEIYRLFDRRCRTETALEKLAQLRRRLVRFGALRKALKKLFSPNLEKALTFLNDDLLPATSNAVERGNRRYRKMQKSIYCVRTREHISQRIAVDMQRDAQAQGRIHTVAALHIARVEWS